MTAGRSEADVGRERMVPARKAQGRDCLPHAVGTCLLRSQSMRLQKQLRGVHGEPANHDSRLHFESRVAVGFSLNQVRRIILKQGGTTMSAVLKAVSAANEGDQS